MILRLLLTFGFALYVCSALSQPTIISNLLCNNRSRPNNVDHKPPRFSWQYRTSQQAFSQSAFKVQVSDSYRALENGVANSWNSGKIRSGHSINIPYGGEPLSAGTSYYWLVTGWDDHGKRYQSKIDSFTTALFTDNDWNDARWIGFEELPDSMLVVPGVHAPDAKKLGDKALKRAVVPLFRKEFITTKKISKATAYITGLGQYELMLNGQKVGTSFLSPAWTFYDKRVQYNVLDVTPQIKNGRNAIGVIVGNGFYYINRERYFKIVTAFGFPKMICKIKIEYQDGSIMTVVSDTSWKTAPSPITYSSIFGGEDYDARLEQAGWNNKDFNDSGWKNALAVKPPKGSLEAEFIYPVVIKDSFEVKNIIQPAKDIFVYDFGQNASGVIDIKVKGKRGQTIKLTPAELLSKELAPNQKASGGPYYFSYTLSSDSIETWRPAFSYYGFRYVLVEGALPASGSSDRQDLARIINLKVLHNSSSAPQTGSFQSSNVLFNRIDTLIKWAIQSNVQSVVTDCPHREKLSWLEQDYLMGKSIHYNLDIYHLYKNLVYNMIDAQTHEGLVPDIAPEFVPFESGFRDSPEWGSASVVLPWQIYKWYGDIDVIRDAFPMMTRYIAYLESKSKNHILSHGLGDWFDYGPKSPGEAQLTPKELTATAIYFYDVSLLSTMAALIGEREEAKRLGEKANEIKTAFNTKFFNTETKIYSTGSQTAMSMPISVGLVEEKYRSAVFKNMVDSINLNGKKLTAGDIGYHFLVDALHAAGASDLLFDMNARDDVPGYGYQLRKGATALTESWPALEEVSNNHLMLGHIMEWFYYGLAGISQSDSSVAYKHVIIKPEPVGDLNFVKGSFRSPYGVIASEWRKSNRTFELTVQIPPNSTATVFVPATKESIITINGKTVKTKNAFNPASHENGKYQIPIKSGKYTILVK
ncbi:family 78 glycoside hydrolase catalytic domain [Flavitalea antarctica]